MMRGERIRGALILATAFLLAAGVGLAMSMGFESGSRPVADALAPAEIAAALPAVPETLRVHGLSTLHQRPPVRPLPRHRAHRTKHRRPHVHRVVRAVAAAAPAPVPPPTPTPAPAPANVVVAPRPAPAPAPRPKPAPKPQAPVVFDDSA
jgi:hypothetical protein